VEDLLTTRQLQELLQVDRITIYRMLNDGRLRGFKVGGQWRFSRREIEAWLLEQQSHLEVTETPPNGRGRIAPSPQSLPLSCIQTIQDVCAEALDIAAVTIDPAGSPLTKISNSCDFCDLILSTEEGLRRCCAAWSRVGNGQIHVCHAEMLCISAPIQVSGQQVAITAGCQFAAHTLDGSEPEWHTHVPRLAAELGLPGPELQARTSSVRIVPAGYLPRVSHLLRRVAETFSEIGQERLDLLSRMQHISEMRKL
jgi:excisionase family DNA binding protein